MSTHSDFITLNDGARVPWLAFGTGSFLWKRDAGSFVKTALENGVVHLDSAQMYSNEQTTGAALAAAKQPRESLYVVTKLDRVPAGKTVRDTLVDSLENLQLKYVDLFLVHDPTAHPDLKQVWKEMEQLKVEGLAKSIGVSNFRISDLKLILDSATIIPAVNQIEYHPYVVKYAGPIARFAREHGITIAGYSPLSTVARSTGGPVDPVVEKIRKRLEEVGGKPVTSAQVILKWLNQQEIIVVTTTSKAERIQEYLGASSVPALTAEEIAAIEEAGLQRYERNYMSHIFDQ